MWRIPSERMKAGVEHRVPLSQQALEVLGEAPGLHDVVRPGVPVADEAEVADVGHDADEGAAVDRPR